MTADDDPGEQLVDFLTRRLIMEDQSIQLKMTQFCKHMNQNFMKETSGRTFNVIPYLLLIPGIAYLIFMFVGSARDRNSMEWELSRLYWEYAGRVLDRPVTAEFPIWVQQRTGSPIPTSDAVRLTHRIAPYTDFPCEYPPGALLSFSLIRLLFDDIASFSIAFYLSMIVCFAATGLILTRLSDAPASAALTALGYSLWPPLLGRMVVIRFDALTILIVALALLSWSRNRPRFAAALLGLGGSVKLWPALLLPFVVLARRNDGGSRWSAREALALAIVGTLTFVAPHVAALAIGTAPLDVMGYLRYLGDRPPEIESLLANAYALLHVAGIVEVTPQFSFGSHNLVGPGWQVLAKAITVAFGVSYLGLAATFARRKSDLRTLTAVMGLVVGLLIATSKVFSGEYMVWLIPFCTLLLGYRRWDVGVCFIVSLLALKASFRSWDSVIALAPFGTGIVAIKNLALLATLACLFWDFLRHRGALSGSAAPNPHQT